MKVAVFLFCPGLIKAVNYTVLYLFYKWFQVSGFVVH